MTPIPAGWALVSGGVSLTEYKAELEKKYNWSETASWAPLITQAGVLHSRGATDDEIAILLRCEPAEAMAYVSRAQGYGLSSTWDARMADMQRREAEAAAAAAKVAERAVRQAQAAADWRRLCDKYDAASLRNLSRPAQAAELVRRGASLVDAAIVMAVEVETVRAHLRVAKARVPRKAGTPIFARLAARYREVLPGPIAVDQAAYETDARIGRAIAAGATIAECARATGRSQGTIRMRLARAHERGVSPIEAYLSEAGDEPILRRLHRGLGLPKPAPLWGNEMFGAFAGMAL